jgi:mannose-6-phosphate isomerase-like protein (cupin superfamily)
MREQDGPAEHEMRISVASSTKASIKANATTPEYFFAEGCFITELSNSSDDPQVSIARARLEPGKTTRWHYLRVTTERYVVLQGAGLVEVDVLPAQHVGCGDVVIIPAGARQRISNTGTIDLVFLAICAPRFTSGVYVDIED